MRLRTLNALIAPAGVEPFSYRDGDRWERLTPTSITREGDRGEQHVETFRDEDELCRHLLVRTLARKPPRPGARRHEPDLPLMPIDDVAAPAPRWRLGLPPRTEVVGRGRGLVVLCDTTGLLVDARHGASQVTVLDAATGEVVASWLPPGAIGTALVVGDDEPVVVLGGDGLTRAFTVGGEPLWSFDRAGWQPTIDAGGVVVLQETARWVGRMVRIGGDAVALDVRTGQERWSHPGLSRVGFAFWGTPRLDRFFAWRTDGARLDVVRVDLATGSTRVLARGDLPAEYAGADLTVLEDLMDADCVVGHVTIRTSAPRPGGAGTLLGDLLVVAGDPAVRLPTAPASLGERPYRELLGSSFEPGRLVTGADDVRCTDLAGAVLWTRPGRGIVRDRAADVVLMETRGVVEAIARDGSTRWERPGSLETVARDAVWVRDDTTIDVVDPATGHSLWTGRAPWSMAEAPRASAHPDDQVVLVADGSVLRAFGRP